MSLEHLDLRSKFERLKEWRPELGPKAIGVIVGLVAVVVGVVLWLALKPAANNANFPDGTWWVCPNGHNFQMSVAALAAHHKDHRGEPVPCPTCNAPSDRADKCPHCGSVFKMIRNQDTCPVCKKPLTP